MKSKSKVKTKATNFRVDDPAAAFRKTEELARAVLSVPKSQVVKPKKKRRRASRVSAVV